MKKGRSGADGGGMAMGGWRAYASEWWMVFILGALVCAVGCKVWLENRDGLVRLAGIAASRLDGLW